MVLTLSESYLVVGYILSIHGILKNSSLYLFLFLGFQCAFLYIASKYLIMVNKAPASPTTYVPLTFQLRSLSVFVTEVVIIYNYFN